MDGETLAAVIRWSGVGVALAGAVLTSPDGVKRLWHGIVRIIRRMFRRSPQDPTFSAHLINSNLKASDHLKADLKWGPGSPLEHRINILLSRIEGLTEELAKAKSELTARLDEHEQKIAHLSNAIHTARIELHELITANEDRAAQVDAFGLPVIGLGIFLSGVPEDLAAVPWLGVSLTYISLYVTYIVALLGINRGAWSGKLA